MAEIGFGGRCFHNTLNLQLFLSVESRVPKVPIPSQIPWTGGTAYRASCPFTSQSISLGPGLLLPAESRPEGGQGRGAGACFHTPCSQGQGGTRGLILCLQLHLCRSPLLLSYHSPFHAAIQAEEGKRRRRAQGPMWVGGGLYLIYPSIKYSVNTSCMPGSRPGSEESGVSLQS